MIAKAIRKDREAAESEYGGRFRSDIASYVSPEIVDACTEHGCHERGPIDGVFHVAFCDMAGGSGKDSATLAVAHYAAGKAILDCIREILPPFSPDQVCHEFSDLLKRYRLNHVRGDKYDGYWPKERFQEHGITYEPEKRSKSEMYVELLPLLNSGEVILLDNETLRRQLRALERRTHAGGRQSVDHPGKGHDDVINSACGALLRAHGERVVSPGKIDIAPSLTRQFDLALSDKAEFWDSLEAQARFRERFGGYDWD